MRTTPGTPADGSTRSAVHCAGHPPRSPDDGRAAAASGVPRGRPALKRGIDLVAALALLAASAPLIALSMLVIAVESPGSPLFVQERVGRHGRRFRLLKLRTLYRDRFGIEPGELLPGDPRVTPWGAWFRRLKVDELPQLINVIAGDMALVGPRPDLPVQAARYDERDRRRLSVRPGLTGIAQVSGNIHVPWADRIRMDVWYAEHHDLVVDMRILLATAGVVIRGERASDDPLGVRARQVPFRDGQATSGGCGRIRAGAPKPGGWRR